jgi:hypothetical protein
VFYHHLIQSGITITSSTDKWRLQDNTTSILHLLVELLHTSRGWWNDVNNDNLRMLLISAIFFRKYRCTQQLLETLRVQVIAFFVFVRTFLCTHIYCQRNASSSFPVLVSIRIGCIWWYHPYTRRSVVSWGAILQARRSRVRFPMGSLHF